MIAGVTWTPDVHNDKEYWKHEAIFCTVRTLLSALKTIEDYERLLEYNPMHPYAHNIGASIIRERQNIAYYTSKIIKFVDEYYGEESR